MYIVLTVHLFGANIKVIIIIFIIIIIIIIKTSSTGPSGKNKIAYKLLSQPHHHLRHVKLKKHNSGKQPAIDCSHKPI